MGFIGALIDDDAVRAAIVRRGACFGGVSSGCLAAMYAMAITYGGGRFTMREFYARIMRKGYEAIERGTTLTMKHSLEWGAREYYARVRWFAPWSTRLHVLINGVLTRRLCSSKG